MSDPAQTLDTCNTLLRGEIAAVEAYTVVLRRFNSSSKDPILERIRADHQANADLLERFISESGARPARGAGWWKGLVVAAKSAGTLFGESPVIKILQVVERCGSTRYQDALNSPDVANVAKRLIRNLLLPTVQPHQRQLQIRQQYFA
jgi:hypothetical protein